MKVMYIKPEVEITKVGTYSILNSVSGLGLNEGGEDNGTNTPQAPGRRRPF